MPRTTETTTSEEGCGPRARMPGLGLAGSPRPARPGPAPPGGQGAARGEHLEAMERGSLPLPEAGPGAGGAERCSDAGGPAASQARHGWGPLRMHSSLHWKTSSSRGQSAGGWAGGGAAPQGGWRREGVSGSWPALGMRLSKSELRAAGVNCPAGSTSPRPI